AEEEESAGEEEDSAADSTDEEEDSTAEDSTAEGAAEPTEVEVGAEFTDEETGDEFTIVPAVRDNPTEYYEATDNPDGEMVYLEVSVVPGDAYGGTISASDFYLVDGEGEEIDYAASADDEM